MNPITDEVILSLMESAERRQRSQAPASETARPSKPITHPEGGRIISLEFTHRKARARQMVGGLYCNLHRA